MPLKPATEDDMLKQGFPKELQTAFKQTAEETQCIVLSRAPGPATTELIAAGHDLKGFFIKAKSCDWGPMSGFLCQVSAFNKKGVAGIKHNAKQNLKYYEIFRDRLHSPQEGLDKAEGKTSAKNERIKAIFATNNLQWQEEWDNLLLGTAEDPIKETRNFFKGKSDQKAVSDLSDPVGKDKKVFKDDSLDPNNKSNAKYSELLNTVVQDLRTLVGDDSPFVPLKLTEKVFQKFKKSNSQYTKTIDDITCGIAYKKTGEKTSESFVWFKYIVKKNQEGLYELYHGDIWIFADDKRSLLHDYCNNNTITEPDNELGKLGISTPESKKSKNGCLVKDLCGENNDKVVKAIDSICTEFKPNNLVDREKQSIEKELFYPIKGIQNYYPPFSGNNKHLNAVTGDYDLFACWPKIPSGGLEDLVRQSELAPAPDALFSRMSSNPHSLRSTVSINVFLEFIPTFKELETLKAAHPSFGNSNGLVLLVAGTLNSFVNTVRYTFKKAPRTVLGRNVAFHGDEGGRPEIDAVDYDVAAFVPAVLMKTRGVAEGLGVDYNKKKAKPEMFVVKQHVDLLTLINAVKSECYVPLNFAWVYDFFKSGENEVKELLKALFCTPPKNAKAANAEEKKKQDTEHETLQTKFKLLFRTNQDGTHPPDSEFFAEVGAKINGFMNTVPDA